MDIIILQWAKLVLRKVSALCPVNIEEFSENIQSDFFSRSSF